MTQLPTTPFPELQPLEQKRKVPSLAELLGADSKLPVNAPPEPVPLPGRRHLRGLSDLPKAGPAAEEQAPKPSVVESLLDMPVSATAPTDRLPASPMSEKVAASMEEDDESGDSAAEQEFAMPVPPQRERRTTRPTSEPPRSTDDELKDALLPLLETSLTKALYAPETGIHTYLEPMLRSTVRRALAEQMDSSRQFGEIGALDRLAWRLSALFSSRTYDEIVFDRTRRFQVEEVYLIRKCDRSLISYASHDPSRHASTRRVQSTLRFLIRKLGREKDEVRTTYELPEKRTLLVRTGKHCLLLAILRGADNALVRADLDYVLRQCEERFGDRLNRSSEAFLQILQPILEGCLLIQSPAPPK